MSVAQVYEGEVVPSIKGAVFLQSIVGVRRLLEAGRVAREQAELWLEPHEIRYLDEKIVPGCWYPVETFDRFIGITVEVLGCDEAAFMSAEGRRSAQKILSFETYQRFGEVARDRGVKSGRSMLTMSRLMYNFTRWEMSNPTGDPGCFEIRVSEASAFPDSLRYANHGFIGHMAEILARGPVRVTSERPHPDLIVYRGCNAA